MFRFNDGRDWFLRRRLGLFLHWGLYAINGIQEQEQQRCGVPADEYRKLIGKFNPAPVRSGRLGRFRPAQRIRIYGHHRQTP